MDIRGHWCRIEWQSESGMMSCTDFEAVSLLSGKSYEVRPAAAAPGRDVSTVTQWNPLGSLPTPETSQHERWGYAPELRLFAAIVRGELPAECTIADAARSMRLGEELLAIERQHQH